jgi:hypothetical protein
MPSVCSKTASDLSCTEKQLRDVLNHPDSRQQIEAQLIGKKVRTTYEDCNGFRKTFFIDGITRRGADSIMAYGKMSRPYNVCIAAHYYVRHRIRLQYPYLPCVIEKFRTGSEHR